MLFYLIENENHYQYYLILFNIIQYYPVLFNIIQYYLMLILSNIIENGNHYQYYPILSNIIQYYPILSNIIQKYSKSRKRPSTVILRYYRILVSPKFFSAQGVLPVLPFSSKSQPLPHSVKFQNFSSLLH